MVIDRYYYLSTYMTKVDLWILILYIQNGLSGTHLSIVSEVDSLGAASLAACGGSKSSRRVSRASEDAFSRNPGDDMRHPCTRRASDTAHNNF